MNVHDLKTSTKVLIASAGVLDMGGVGLGAANATTPSSAITHSVTADIPTPGEVGDPGFSVNGASEDHEVPRRCRHGVETAGGFFWS